jgi:hypothetical protein
LFTVGPLRLGRCGGLSILGTDFFHRQWPSEWNRFAIAKRR